MGETPRKHAAALRRSLAQFLRLAAACRDLAALEGAATTLALPPPATAPPAAAHMPDLCRRAARAGFRTTLEFTQRGGFRNKKRGNN